MVPMGTPSGKHKRALMALGQPMAVFQHDPDIESPYSTEAGVKTILAYGITARVARMGIELARKEGVRVGFIRPIVIWPFPESRIRELAPSIKAFVVPEINLGQIVLEVERCAAGRTAAIPVTHPGGGVHDPAAICEAIVGAVR